MLSRYLDETVNIVSNLKESEIDAVLSVLRSTPGRIFLAGNGGGAGHASHAANDFRKIAGWQAVCISDNVSELTARANDDGWDDCYAGFLRASRVSWSDSLFVFSVGGGSPSVSRNLVAAIDCAREHNATVTGIVGKNGGYLAEKADACIRIPSDSTPHVEGIQAVLWHLLCSA